MFMKFHSFSTNVQGISWNPQFFDEFYRNSCTNCEFVYVEDDTEQKFHDFNDDDIHHLHVNSDEYCRPLCYNIGADLSNRKFKYFLDADCIIHPAHILKSVELLTADKTIGAVNPYNGTAFYTHYNVKHAFTESTTYDTLNNFFPDVDS